MGRIVRTLSEDGSVLACAVDTTDVVGEMESFHKTSAVVTAGLGRLITAASMMGSMLKGDDDSLTLRINGGGPTGSLIAVSDSRGNVKGYVANPIVEIPLNQHGKLDVAGAVGTDGYLSIAKDLGLKEPYTGQTPIISGEIAEDITHYYAVSEQTPTVCSLGVLVNPDLTVKAAGGFLVQLLPFAPESSIDVIERNIKNMSSITQMLESGLTSEEIALEALSGLNAQVLDSWEVAYKCDCSRSRIERALISLGEVDLTDMIKLNKDTEVSCHFCDKVYSFTPADLEVLLKSSK